MPNIEEFKQHVIDAGVLDAEGIHHEFVSGSHGRKLDFDIIETGSPLYEEWIDVTSDFIADNFPDLPAIIIGVANGTNRVALDTARRLGDGVTGFVSEKDPKNSKVIRLGDETSKRIQAIRPELVVVVEDVGTTGGSSVQVARNALEAGAKEVEVFTTWQRRPQLERLIELGVPYRAIIKEILPTYDPDECRESGFCSQGWQLIPRT